MTNIRRKLEVSAAVLVAFLLLTISRPIAFADDPLTFSVIGDSGEIGSKQRRIAAQMKHYRDTNGRFDFVLMLGDNIYNDGIGRGFSEHFEVPYKDLLDAGVKFYAVLGNHDIRRGTEAQINYPNFNMGGRRFYSFKMGGELVEFFALDATPLSEEAEALVAQELERLKRQRLKLEKRIAFLRKLTNKTAMIDLRVTRQQKMVESIDATITTKERFLQEQKNTREAQIPWLIRSLHESTARWKVVFLHHAIYSSAYMRTGHGRDDAVLRLRRLLEPIFIDKKVNVVFAGHDHVVEQVKPQGPAGGHQVYYVTEGASSRLREGDLDEGNPSYEWGVDNKCSFLVVRLAENEMVVEVIDDRGNLLRRFTIPRLG